MPDYIEVTVTIDNKKIAVRIANELLDKRLAACVQISGPVESFYEWDGKRTRTREWKLAIKTRDDIFSMVEKAVKELHPYAVPEIIIRKIEGGSGDYLEWIERSVYEKPGI